jgi:hypothetical protein
MRLNKVNSIAAVILLVLAASLLPAVHAENTTLYPTDDAYVVNVNGANLDDNFGALPTLSVMYYTPVTGVVFDYMSFIHFDLSGIPSGSTINSANLRLHVRESLFQGVGNEGTVEVYRVDDSWSEATITWNNQPEILSTGISRYFAFSDQGSYVSFDLTSEVQAMVDGADNYGWCLSGSQTDKPIVSFESKDWVNVDYDLHPALIIDYTIGTTEEAVDIDIKPGTYPNDINLLSKGKVPVAILGSDVFDVTTIYPDTVTFAGATPFHWAFKDVNSDGYTDMILQFKIQDTLSLLNSASTEATLTGETLSGDPITGTDTVNIVQS